MKLLVVLFALTAVTGGQARTIREAPSSESSLGQLWDKFFEFGTISTFTVYEKVGKLIEDSDITVVTEQLDKISEILREEERALPPEIEEVKEIVSNLSKTYKVKNSRVFNEWNRRLSQETEGVMKALALYVEPVTSKALWCVEWLEENVKPMVVEMYQTFDSSFDQALESLGSMLSSYTKEQEEIGEILQILVSRVTKQLRLEMEAFNKNFKHYLIPFLKEYKKYDPALREWMERPLFPPPKED